MRRLLIIVAFLTVSTAAHAEMWLGNPTPQESPMNQTCRVLQIGFLAAAPCLSEYSLALGRPHDRLMAVKINALARDVHAGRISNKNALLKYEEIRAERNSINTRANIGAMLGAFATGVAAGTPRTTTCNRIGASVQCQTW